MIVDLIYKKRKALSINVCIKKNCPQDTPHIDETEEKEKKKCYTNYIF